MNHFKENTKQLFTIKICLIVLLVLGFFSCRPTKYLPEDKYLLKKIRIEIDNKHIDEEELKAYIKQQPNKRFFKVLPFHARVYNMVNPEREEKRAVKRKNNEEVKNKKRQKKNKPPVDKFYLTEWLLEIGEKPVVYDENLTSKSTKQIAMYLKNKGYYNPVVTDSLKYYKRSSKKLKVIYKIKTNKPYTYRNISYNIEDPRIKKIIDSSSSSTLLSQNELFDVDILQSERERITRLLKTRGYFSFMKEYIDFQVDSALKKQQVDLTFRVRNPGNSETDSASVHKQFWINNVYVYMNFDPKSAINDKENYYNEFDTVYYKGFYLIYKDKLPMKPDVIVGAISIEKDDLYDINNVEKTYKFLSALQVFKLSNILFAIADTSNGNKSYIDCTIQLTPFMKQSHIAELEGTNTSGNLGVAANFKYQHKSVFGGAEFLELKFKGGMQAQTKIVETPSDDGIVIEHLPFNTLELGPEISLKFPKLLLPFELSEFTKEYHPKTSFSVAYNYQSRPEYSRTILTQKFGFFWRDKLNVTHFINPIEINSIKLTNVDSAFQEQINSSLFKNSYQNQLIAAANYNLVFTNQDLQKNDNFSFLKAGVEIAGNMFSLYKSIGKVAVDNADLIFGVEYAQYAKLDIDYSYHKILNGQNNIVYRGLLGVGMPYGNSNTMPFVKQYFAGGANSIRAWPVRSLGPGTYQNSDTQSYPNMTSDLRLETNLEYRFDVISMLEGALFVDAGNIWSINKNDERTGAQFQFNDFYKEFAVGAGIGARLDFDFFIFRLDLGYKIVDPTEPEGSRFVLGRTPIRNEYQWVVGIGYPF